MMAAAKRSYGTGSVYVRTDAGGVEHFYGAWRANGRRMHRKLGVKRPRGSREGLTQKQAEANLRRLMADETPTAALAERLTLSEAGLRYRDPHTGGPLEKAALLRRYRKALKAARLDTTHRFHDLRHTFGTAMAAAGVPMRTPSGVDGPQGHQDDRKVCRLCAERA